MHNIFSDDKSTYHFSINGENIVRDYDCVKFNTLVLDDIKNILNNSIVSSFNITLTLKDSTEKYREDYPLNWFASNIIFCGGKYDDDCKNEHENIGLMSFSSNNISLVYSKNKEKKLSTKSDLEIFVDDLVDLHKFYVSTNNEISVKLNNIFK